jgi:hypothetical protein
MGKKLSELDRPDDIDVLLNHLIDEMSDPPVPGVGEPEIEFHGDEVYLILPIPKFADCVRTMDLTELPDPWVARCVWQDADGMKLSITKS